MFRSRNCVGGTLLQGEEEIGSFNWLRDAYRYKWHQGFMEREEEAEEGSGGIIGILQIV